MSVYSTQPRFHEKKGMKCLTQGHNTAQNLEIASGKPNEQLSQKMATQLPRGVVERHNTSSANA